MAGILFDARKIEKALTPLRCTKLSAPPFTSKLIPTPHYMWQTAWGHKFMVPEACAHWVLEDIIEREVKGTRPKDWKEQ